MLCSLPRVRSVVEISYGCMGRSDRHARTARANGLDTLRRDIRTSITRTGVSGRCYPSSTPGRGPAGQPEGWPAGRGWSELAAPLVRDVDDDARAVAGGGGAREREHPERQPRPDAEPDARDAFG